MKCERCNSEKVVRGRIFNQVDYVSPKAFFRPRELRPFALFGIHVRVKKNDFFACTECGFVWTTIDAEKLTKLIAKNCRKSLKKKLGLEKG